MPITKDEIEKGLIFQPGYVGSIARKIRETGMGIGLPDALSVVREHEGEIIVESNPALPDSDSHDYDKPFLTKFTLKLPRYELGEAK